MQSWAPESRRISHHGPSIATTRYLSRALFLSRSPEMYTRSPTAKSAITAGLAKGVLDFWLIGWFFDLDWCWDSIKCKSLTEISVLWYMSLWVHVSQLDRPRPRIRLLRRDTARVRVRSVMAPPRGSSLSISASNSWTARSASGFLLVFLWRPISTWTRWCDRRSSLVRAQKPVPGSVRMTAGGPARGMKLFVSFIMASRSVGCCSLSMKQAKV